MNYYNEIKEQLINNEVYKKVKDYSKNRSDLNTYYNVGKLLYEAGKNYGEGIIKNYSIKLTNELGKGYNITSLKRMRQFYLFIEKGAAMRHQLTWTHYRELLQLNNYNEINYYINISIQQNLSYRQLHEKIKNKEYERLDEDTKNKLIKKEKIEVNDFIKDPILIKNKYNKENISEKVLQQLILEDLPSFLKELGNGFSFIDNEYKIKIGDRYNYIDLLLFNYIYNCFIVIELKITELKAEHIGQITKYMNYIDKNVKNINQGKTIGIIIVKKENKFIMEYCSDDRIFTAKYEFI
jgi:predicted nuclease of restriction endonuclease-like (RecB) superfamily